MTRLLNNGVSELSDYVTCPISNVYVRVSAAAKQTQTKLTCRKVSGGVYVSLIVKKTTF